jgi:RHS repeat-associated protein
VTCQAYDAEGIVISVTVGLGAVTAFEYDALNRPVRRTDPSGRVQTFVYDANGNATTVTDASSQIGRSYDGVDQLVSETAGAGPGAESTGLTYDAVGRLISLTNSAAALTTAYNRVDDRVAATLDGSPDGPQSRIDYTVTKTGRRATLAVATGSNPVQNVVYAYDAAGRLATLTTDGPAAFALEYRYDDAGRPASRRPMAGGSGVATSFALDGSGRLTRMIQTNPDGGALFGDFRYAYDALGNVLTAQDDEGTTTYMYDAVYRVTGVTAPGFAETYTYDATGNRLSKGGLSYTYDVAGHLVSSSDGTTYTYDEHDNLRTRTAGGAMTTYTWNARNQLTRIDFPDGTTATYTYDAMGRRLSKQDRNGVVRYYVYDGENLVQELDAAGSVIAGYVYDSIDHPLNMTRGGVTYHYLHDQLGSVIGLTDGVGDLVVRYRYDPWGNLLSTEGSDPDLENPLRFTGREWDAESGLYFYRMRYYDPAVGRFISRDRLEKGSASSYAYASNNPVNATDPTGLFTWDWGTRRAVQVVGGVAVGFVGGLVAIATLPATAGVALTLAVGAGAGAVSGGVFGLGVEAGTTAETDCTRNYGEAFKLAAKAGFVGGAIAAFPPVHEAIGGYITEFKALNGTLFGEAAIGSSTKLAEIMTATALGGGSAGVIKGGLVSGGIVFGILAGHWTGLW